MTASSSVTAALTLAILGLLTSVIAALIVATNNSAVLITIGVLLVVFALQRLISAVLTKDDSKKRWTTFWTGLFCAFGGMVLFFEDTELRQTSSTLTVIVLFSLTAIAVSTVLSNYYQYVTRKVFPSVLESAELGPSDERLLYFAVNLFAGFLVGITVGASKPENKLGYMDGSGLAYSIPIWFMNAIILLIVGAKWGSTDVKIGARYESASVPFARGSSYTDELSNQ
jgi:uncharacterized membrane protein HdeD (DUF308 family)